MPTAISYPALDPKGVSNGCACLSGYYDAAYYLTEGCLSIECGGKTYTGWAGDIFFLEKGSDVRYDATRGGCTLFWVAYPGNWQEISNLPTPQK